MSNRYRRLSAQKADLPHPVVMSILLGLTLTLLEWLGVKALF